MNKPVGLSVVVVGVALAMSLITPVKPASTQDRGTPVVVTNTLAEPLPARVVNTDPLPTRPANDPRSPLFIAPGDRSTFNVCPVSCGAYQVWAESSGDSALARVALPVPPATRFVIRYLSVKASRRGPGGILVSLSPWFTTPNGVEVQVLHLPVDLEATIEARRFFHGSFPVVIHHDTGNHDLEVRAIAPSDGSVDADAGLSVFASGNLEPLP